MNLEETGLEFNLSQVGVPRLPLFELGNPLLIQEFNSSHENKKPYVSFSIFEACNFSYLPYVSASDELKKFLITDGINPAAPIIHTYTQLFSKQRNCFLKIGSPIEKLLTIDSNSKIVLSCRYPIVDAPSTKKSTTLVGPYSFISI